ncbi:hypothetical protein CW748_12245 [Alteromonadales bacterium alter-6D02]|nr:hypothetical protein CW748_12245 [Alteromonadales bacterium alter-6D02]
MAGFFFLLFSANVLANTSIPEPLKPWVPWVLAGDDQRNCPFINNTRFGKKHNHICAWPSTLQLEVFDKSARFSLNWQVLTPSTVPLPGNHQHWPQQVEVNGKAKAVIEQNGRPVIKLTTGDYHIEGLFKWQRIPQTLAVPPQYALIDMQVKDQAIDFPKVEANMLWLKKLTPIAAKQDALDIQVARRVSDGAYLSLATYISLNVSGKMREVALGTLLPQGFKLVGLNSKLSVFLDSEGVLQAKVKPGRHEIMAYAYAKPSLLSWTKPAQSHQWPQQEVWTFQGDERLRIGKLTGVPAIDSNQAKMPNDWYKLPSYLMTSKDTLTFEVQHRGKPLHLENQLTLTRSLWLSFDNDSFAFNDRLRGSMLDNWRLGMSAPFELESAENQDGPMLITSLNNNERGIENRYPNLDVQARGQIEATSSLPITGWQSHFERVSLELNLPPGHQLFAVFGADHVSNSWLSSWSIWASFIVLFLALIAGRLIGIVAGVVTGLMMLFVYQESGAPIAAVFNLLLAIALKQHQPFKRIEGMVRTYWLMSAVIAVATVLYFSAIQLRTVLHPQLESKQVSYVMQKEDEMRHKQEAIESRARQAQQKALSQQKAMARPMTDANEYERIEVTASKVKLSESMTLYQSDAQMQAGSGIPSWEWNKYHINWHSPVAQEQSFDVLILSKNSYRVVKVLGVLLSVFCLFLLLKASISELVQRIDKKNVSAACALLLLLPLSSFDTSASQFPDQPLLTELKKRLTKSPECAPQCATINDLVLVTEGKELVLTLNVHAQVSSAVALPKSLFWQPQRVLINGKLAKRLFKHNNWVYVPVAKGITKLNLIGQVAPVDAFQLKFKQNPKFITIEPTKLWQVVGYQNNRLVGNTLEFTSLQPKQGDNERASSRYTYSPFVKVTRTLTIDQQWSVNTVVERVAPHAGSITLTIPTLQGEHVLSNEIEVNEGSVVATIASGKSQFSWRSTLDRTEQLRLQTEAGQSFSEIWHVVVSPAWHVSLDGPPVILGEQDPDDYFVTSFYPYAGEALTMALSRPTVSKGHVLAIDNVRYHIEQGTRTSTLDLAFKYRSTRGGEHTIELPEGYQLKEIRIDNKLINLQLEQGRLTLPIQPGHHHVKIEMRASVSEQLLLTSPKVNLGAPVSNIDTVYDISEQRWVLWTQGPALGPAVLYWGELIAFILLALLLARVKFSPLNTANWIILGFGLSLNNWGVLILLALWFGAVSASTYRPKTLDRVAFNISQLLLYGLSIIAILSLISVIPASLLSSADMGVAGNNSYGNHLKWFADQSSGELPQVTVFNISNLFYKGIMLIWVIWLSFSFISWIKWAWQQLGVQGYWRTEEKKAQTKDDEK